MKTKPYLLVFSMFLLFACTPRIELAMSDKPITINLNVKIDHEVRVKIDKELDDLFDEESAMF